MQLRPGQQAPAQQGTSCLIEPDGFSVPLIVKTDELQSPLAVPKPLCGCPVNAQQNAETVGTENWCPLLTGILLLTSYLLVLFATKRTLVLHSLYWLKRKLTPSAGVNLSSCLLLAQILEQKPVLSRNEFSFVLIAVIHPSSRQPQDQQAPKR